MTMYTVLFELKIDSSLLQYILTIGSVLLTLHIPQTPISPRFTHFRKEQASKFLAETLFQNLIESIILL